MFNPIVLYLLPLRMFRAALEVPLFVDAKHFFHCETIYTTLICRCLVLKHESQVSQRFHDRTEEIMVCLDHLSWDQPQVLQAVKSFNLAGCMLTDSNTTGRRVGGVERLGIIDQPGNVSCRCP
ncbi:hypothetical protein WN55_05432 [Dufourea novaeangliae]|uniref:Secreted protein n=1 Tax=Dufourea novaeangliae TaxID=178035 RepID=A0A154P0Q0_DUFNO|nr:hypothetical protein WN55_05432 [Dufourea novaeangliae]